jgi:hypothetical protein
VLILTTAPLERLSNCLFIIFRYFRSIIGIIRKLNYLACNCGMHFTVFYFFYFIKDCKINLTVFAVFLSLKHLFILFFITTISTKEMFQRQKTIYCLLNKNNKRQQNKFYCLCCLCCLSVFETSL